MSYRAELTQVGAVAVAMLEDEMFGAANTYPNQGEQTTKALMRVSRERFRQDEKWGPQHHDKLVWLMILMEEVGEMAEEIEAPDPTRGPYPFTRSTYDMIVHAGQRARQFLIHEFGESQA